LASKTYRLLRDQILARTIPAGGKVTADGVTQRFGVSRTTAKSALDQLAAERLLEVRPQVGTFVRGLTARDIHDLWEVRAIIESAAARRGTVTATEAQRRELRAVVEELAPLVEGHEYREETYRRSVALNRRLHELVVETAGNARLMDIYRQLEAYVHITNYRSRRGLRRADLALEEHRAIAAAYQRRDPDLAASTVTRHIERSRDAVLQAIAKLGGVL
jgi:DNA-binding GntR family transcriptional regulator